MKAILFTNYSCDDFTHTWDSTEYHFPAKQSIMLEPALAFHFAKHLATRELNRKGDLASKKNIEAEMHNAITKETDIEGEDETQLKQEVVNYNVMKKGDLVKEAVEKGIDTTNKKKADIIKDLEEFEG